MIYREQVGHLAHAALGVGSLEAGIATLPHFLEPRFWPVTGTCTSMRLTAHLGA
jgi:hypothetical protein